MDYLNWELSVLSRAIAYSNISGAASQIGISQPQISRIIAKLESELDVVLLDRDSKRKAAWTPAAFKLSELYAQTFLSFKQSLAALAHSADPVLIRVGALEGLRDIAGKFCSNLFGKTSCTTIELEINDVNALEERYLKGNLEFMFSLREPGRKKPLHSHTLGYQSMDQYSIALDEKSNESKDPIQVLSSFEYASQNLIKKSRQHQSKQRYFVSNSLSVRETWIKDQKGHGTLPSTVYTRRKNKSGELPVLLLAPDHISKNLWQNAVKSLRSDSV